MEDKIIVSAQEVDVVFFFVVFVLATGAARPYIYKYIYVKYNIIFYDRKLQSARTVRLRKTHNIIFKCIIIL